MAETQGLDPLQSAAAAAPTQTPAAPTMEQVRAVAAQFESLLLGQMLKEMRASMFDDDDKETGFGGGPLSETLYSELSISLSRAGGVGLGRAMTDAIARQAGAGQGDVGVDAPAGLVFPDAAVAPAAAALAAPGPALLAPAGRVSSSYGWRQDPIDGQLKFHKGTDIAMPIGQEVPSALAGQVTFAGDMAGYGLTVVVNHGGGVETRYAHLSEVEVRAGDAVAQGQTIAKSGSSGRSTGPHLHFEVLESGQPVDPSAVFGLPKQH